METRYAINDEVVAIRTEREGDGYRVMVGERSYFVRARPGPAGRLMLEIDGQRVLAHVAADGVRRYVALNGQSYELAPPARKGRAHHAGEGEDLLEATMPGQVIAVKVAPGEAVARGQTLLVLEAMKMELRVAAPHAGTVRAVHVAPGETVERGQRLVELGAEAPPPA